MRGYSSEKESFAKIPLKRDFILWPIAMVLFFFTNSLLFWSLPVSITFAIKIVALALPLIFRVVLSHKLIVVGKHFIPKFVLVTSVLAVLYPMSQISGHGAPFLGQFLFITVLVLVNFCVMENGEIFSLFEKFERIVVFFAIISLFFWLFGETLHIVPPMGTVHTEWSGTVANYFFLHFGAQDTRNCGWFVEAPMYNLVLCTAIFFELFVRTKVNRWRLIILIITTITTFSTTGQLLMMGALFVKFVVLSERRLSIIQALLLFLAAVLVVAVIAAAATTILQEKSEGLSYAVRLSFMLKELRAFSHSPFLGHGFFTFSAGTSNSICLILAEGGLWQFFIYITCLVVLPYRLSKIMNRPEFKYFFLFYFAAFSITVSPYLPITYAVMASSAVLFFLEKKHLISLYDEV